MPTACPSCAARSIRPGTFTKVDGRLPSHRRLSVCVRMFRFGLGNVRDCEQECRRAASFPPASFMRPCPMRRSSDTWFVAGLKGTGSNTVVFNDVFVPEHRLVPPAPPGHPPGKKHVGEPSDYFALAAASALRDAGRAGRHGGSGARARRPVGLRSAASCTPRTCVRRIRMSFKKRSVKRRR